MPLRRRGDAGISLVEVLVVLAIIGLMTGASLITLGALGRGDRPEAEALRLAQRLGLAADEVLVTSTPLALVWDARGYAFAGWDAASGDWTGRPIAALAGRHELPAALRLERTDGGGEAPVRIAPDLPQAQVTLDLRGADRGWRVAFDGFSASTAEAVP